MTSIYYDLISVLPKWGSPRPQVQPLPEAGQKAPLPEELPVKDYVPVSSSPGQSFANDGSLGTVLSFVRHCGCPFAEAELRELAHLLLKQPDDIRLRGVVVCMSEEPVARQWFDGVLAREGLTDPSQRETLMRRLTLVPNPSRSLYAAFGFGVLPYGGLFSRSMINELLSLKRERGIVNTATGKGSDRWQNSGGVAVDSNGVVRWTKVAKDAGDRCSWEEAVESLAHARAS